MSNIVPKLNLNKTPNAVESNSLIFAKNIRLDVDSSIHADYGITPMSLTLKNVMHETYQDNKNILNRILLDYTDSITNTEVITLFEKLKKLAENTSNWKIVGVIPDSNEFYLFIHGQYNTGLDEKDNSIFKDVDCIVVYDEKTDKFSPCTCNWNYSGGTIDGKVINNLRGEKILNIGETSNNKTTLIPLKCINLFKSSIKDDESIYTQAPNVPVMNLFKIGTFKYTIPNGTYQFFVRYRIREDFYTNWFPASVDLFTGNSNTLRTNFGTVQYVNTHRDSDNSFILSVNFVQSEDLRDNYKDFQIGFILSHDDAIYGRAWKHFSWDAQTINFDYDAKDALEVEVVDFLTSTYQLYNVGNIDSFKNKLYIANYTETDFNDESLANIAKNITITLGSKTSESDVSFNEFKVADTITIAGSKYIKALEIEGKPVSFTGANGIFGILLGEWRDGKDNYSDIIGRLICKDNENIEYLNIDLAEANNTYNGIYANTSVNKSIASLRATIFNQYSSISEPELNPKNDKIVDIRFKNTISSNNLLVKNSDGNIVYGDTIQNIVEYIYSKERYLSTNGIFVDDNGLINDTFTVIIRHEVKISHKQWLSQDDVVWSDDNGWEPADSYIEVVDDTKYYEQEVTVKFSGGTNRISEHDVIDYSGYSTLVPYQSYDFYIHFVKKTGETTNGYKCGSITAPYKEKANIILYPIFTIKDEYKNGDKIKIPSEYVAYFYSIVHTKNKVATIFDIEEIENSNPDIDSYEGHCFDLNLGLIHGTTDLNIQYDKKLTDDSTKLIKGKGQYWYSSDSQNIKYWGAYGVVTVDIEGFEQSNDLTPKYKLLYLVSNYSTPITEDIKLIRCTPYFDSSVKSTADTKTENGKKIQIKEMSNIFANMNLLGYICKVNYLDKETTIRYYTDGNLVNYKYGQLSTADEQPKFIELKPYTGDAIEPKVNESDEDVAYPALALENFNFAETHTQYIYSNYNLNYLILTEEPVETFKSYYKGKSDDKVTEKNPAGSKILRLFKSLTMSHVYDFPSMYKDYTRKYYSAYKADEITRYDNTIRSSMLEGDENYINIFKFHPNDYYNVPTNRGIITNLISIGNSLLVHTQDSMFYFSGNNNLQAVEGDVVQTETQPFDSGITEIFGNEFGFAGLQNKEDSIVTEKGYIFFDRDSKVIYIYSGQGQVSSISDGIEKLFNHRTINNVKFANDFYNNRFFITIWFEDYNRSNVGVHDKTFLIPVTLSFNFGENVKSFVSLHDFAITKAFNTKTKCYFITKDNTNSNDDICIINKNKKFISSYTKLATTNDKYYIYPNRKELNGVQTNSGIYNINQFNSIIDVIVNENYEVIKTLNAVNWCGNVIDVEFPIYDESIENTFIKLAEDLNDSKTCSHMRIYTDTCLSQLFDFNAKQNDSLNNYKYPFFNQGYWTFNYFRNIQNSNNNVDKYVSDENSLIEGKYFVIRFIFDKDFKLETLTLNYNIKQ